MPFSGCVSLLIVAILLLGLAKVAAAQLFATFYYASCPEHAGDDQERHDSGSEQQAEHVSLPWFFRFDKMKKED
jgi:hypothetical protein